MMGYDGAKCKRAMQKNPPGRRTVDRGLVAGRAVVGGWRGGGRSTPPGLPPCGGWGASVYTRSGERKG